MTTAQATAAQQQNLQAFQTASLVYQRMIESGEKEALSELFMEKLIECGWHDQLKGKCRDLIAAHMSGKPHGFVPTTETLLPLLVEYGKDHLPPTVRAELLVTIRKFLQTCTTPTPAPALPPSSSSSTSSSSSSH